MQLNFDVRVYVLLILPFFFPGVANHLSQWFFFLAVYDVAWYVVCDYGLAACR